MVRTNVSLPGIVFGLLLLLGCETGSAESYELRIRDSSLEVEVADTPESRRQGLMFREELEEERGMLFVFDDDAPRSFWMKNTLIPLSIAYIRSDWVILEIYEMEPESLEPVPSNNPARYALEVNRGFFAARNIEPGDRIYPSEGLLERIDG